MARCGTLAAHLATRFHAVKTDPVLPLCVGDYLQDTMHLTRAEHGSYLLLIMAYWAKGGPLENNDPALQSISKCPDSEWIRTRKVLEPFFDVSNGVWKHKRIDADIEKTSKIRVAMLEGSAKGVQARRERGQIPQVQPEVAPKVNPMVQRISAERELERVDKRLDALRNMGTLTAGGPMQFTVPQRAEIKALRDRQEELKKTLGFIA